VVRLHSPAQLIMPFYDVRTADIRCCAAIERQALRHAHRITACSAFVAQAAERDIGLRMAPHVITNGLDLDWFDAAAPDDGGILRALGLPEDRPMVLFTGRLERRKGIGLCGSIAATLLARHDVSLVLAGDDLFGHFQRDVLPALAGRALRGSVHHVGHRPIGEIRALVRRCDVFLLPSLWENCPYSGLEAMAAGRPVVAARQGGMPELIHDGVDGLLAKSGDADDFARCVGSLLDDPALRERLGQAARAAVEQRHRHTDVARQALAVYGQAAAK
jgi:glycosyltransferase involved in cell wall biosynthesis